MTTKDRCLGILRYQQVDRLPAVHFGYWKELLLEWAEQGKIAAELAHGWSDNNEIDHEIDRLIGWECNWSSVCHTNNNLFPSFERKTLATLPDGSQRVQTAYGVIERIKPGLTSIPSEDDYLLKDREAFEALYKSKMQFSPERVNQEKLQQLDQARNHDIPLGLMAGSVLGKIRDFVTVAGMSYLMYDEDEDLFAEIVDTFAEMQYQCVKAALESGAKFDFAHYWEDICFKNGPLLSPRKFEELCAKHYKKRNDLLNSYGIDIISLDCDGVIDQLIPTWLENGVNTMFPLEVGVWGDQFAPARQKYGKELRAVGGMDKTAFRKDKAAVDMELERMARLASLGGFIPCPDHRLMPGSKFELVQYYAEKIKEIKL